MINDFNFENHLGISLILRPNWCCFICIRLGKVVN